MILSKIPEISTLCDRTVAIESWLKNLRLGRTWQLSSQCPTAGFSSNNLNMEVTGRSFQAMPQQDLDGAQIGTRLAQMSGKAVAPMFLGT